jgi:hypothetical protein
MRRRNLRHLLCLASAAGICSIPVAARAVITFGGTGNNYTTAPGDSHVSSVDNYEGQLNGSFTGTMLTSNYAVGAAHTFGAVTQQFTFNDSAAGGTSQTFNTQIAASLDDLELVSLIPGQLDTLGHAATFPASQQAPIYTGNSEVGASMVNVGRGIARAGSVTGGWATDGNQGPFSWGTNTVAAIPTDDDLGTSGRFGGDFVQFTFNNNPSNPNECIDANFDSGGAVFVNNAGTYQLAGINGLVDTVFTAPNSSSPAAAVLYDTFGYYEENADGSFTQITTHTPESSYATRVSSKANFINLVDGTISPANAASFPINVDPNGQMIVYQKMTSGAITGGGSLQVGSIAVTTTLQIAPNSGVSTLSSLSLFNGNGNNSTLDITNNHFILNYGSNPDPISSIQAYLHAGFNNGQWNGASGITSSYVATHTGYGIGYADSADPGNPASLASGTLEVAFTLLGDVNLDHVVNGIDFGVVAANFNKSASRWDQGDFDYNNVVNGVDFGALAANFNKGASAANTEALDAFAAANGLLADVPEPTAGSTLLLAGVAALSLRFHPSRANPRSLLRNS